MLKKLGTCVVLWVFCSLASTVLMADVLPDWGLESRDCISALPEAQADEELPEEPKQVEVPVKVPQSLPVKVVAPPKIALGGGLTTLEGVLVPNKFVRYKKRYPYQLSDKNGHRMAFIDAKDLMVVGSLEELEGKVLRIEGELSHYDDTGETLVMHARILKD